MLQINKIFSTKTLSFIIIVINSIVPLIIWPSGSDYYYYPKIIAVYILVLFLLVVGYIGYKYGSIEIKFTRILIPMMLYISMIILSALFSGYRRQAFLGANYRWEGALAYIAYFLILYFSYLCTNSKQDLQRVIKIMIFSASIISIYGIVQYFGIDPVPRDFIRKAWTFNSFATMGNPNFLGSYLSVIFPAALCLFIFDDTPKQTSYLFICSIIMYTALVCTRTRSLWVGTAFSFSFLSITLGKKLIKKYKRILIFAAACILITSILNNVHNGLITAKFQSIITDYKKVTGMEKDKLKAGSERIFIWTRTIDYVFDRPILGSGPDTFNEVFKMSETEAKQYFSSSNTYVDKAHNEYLQIVVTMGFPALFFYLTFLTAVMYKSAICITGSNFNTLDAALFAGVLAYIVQAFFNISVVSAAPVYWSGLGLLLSSIRMQTKKGNG